MIASSHQHHLPSALFSQPQRAEQQQLQWVPSTRGASISSNLDTPRRPGQQQRRPEDPGVTERAHRHLLPRFGLKLGHLRRGSISGESNRAPIEPFRRDETAPCDTLCYD